MEIIKDSTKAMVRFSPKWWQDKEIAIPWCKEYCEEFVKQDSSLKSNIETYSSLGIVFIHNAKGTVIPVGFTGLQDGNFIFQYHPDYLKDPELPPLSNNLPKRRERFTNKNKVPAFFDNLLAEGWFGDNQKKALGIDTTLLSSAKYGSNKERSETLAERYHRLMMFSRDCPGAASATYIHLDPKIAESQFQGVIESALRSRSTISGMQPKLLGVINEDKLQPANYWETSSHIVKMPAPKMPWILEYEYMSIVATRALLPHDVQVEAALTDLNLRNGNTTPVLAIKRFDRTSEKGKIHFEELNQLLDKPTEDRYSGSYAEMAHFIDGKMGKDGVKQFYARILCQFLLGNCDNHFKNFALFHNIESDKWSMTPDYDLTPSANYKLPRSVALHTTKCTASNFSSPESTERFQNLNARALVTIGLDFGLNLEEIRRITSEIKKNIPNAKKAVSTDLCEKLDQDVSQMNSQETWTPARNPYYTGKLTIREDFLTRIDGRSAQLLGSIDKYLGILRKKNGNGHQSSIATDTQLGISR